MFSHVWSENASLFERLLGGNSFNPPILYYGFNYKSIGEMYFHENLIILKIYVQFH